jgi:hypothetical protein
MTVLSHGFSDAAQFVEISSARGRKDLQNSNTLGLGSGVRDELATVWEECRQPN